MPPEDGHLTLAEAIEATAGDGDSLEALLARYQVRILAAVMAAGCYALRYDARQEALLKVFSALRDNKVKITTIAAFRSWVHTVAVNAARDVMRREGRQPRRFGSIQATANGVSPYEAIVPGNIPTPSQHAHAREELDARRQQFAERLERIAGLKEPDQMLVWMRERDSLTFGEIATELGSILKVELATDTVRIRYSRLLERVGEPVDIVIDDE